VDVGNPHLVCPVADPSTVDLSTPPVLDPVSFPESANVEFVGPGDRPGDGDLQVRMRVYERGSAETLSCGTGACAVALVALRDAGRDAGVVDVDLPGGRLTVAIEGERCRLTGPAVIVAEGDLFLPLPG
jgi:diaminopimelate epimerase